jgi:hypothetical protein
LSSLRERLGRRPAAAAALIYAVLAVALYAPALLPGHALSASDYLWTAAPWAAEPPPDVRPFGSNYELVDSVVQFQPWLQYSRERLPDAPLWNTHVALGRPFQANAVSAWLSPFSLPAYVLPFWWSLGVMAALKLFVAAFGTYLLGRALGLRFGGALLAGLTYAFSLYFLVWNSWPHTGVWALLPWLLLMTERVVRRPGPLPAAGLAAAVAVQYLAGHPESSFHVLATTLAFFAFRALVLRREGTPPALLRASVAWVAAIAGGTALAALTLVPFVELLLRSGDVELRQNFSQLALSERYLLGFTVYDYWGRATEAAVGAFAQERALYAGALPLTLALLAPLLRPSAMRLGVAVFGLAMLAVALGLPPFPDIAQRIPIVRTGNHLRVVVLTMLCLALLAGWGLDDLAGRGIARRRIVLVVAAGLLVGPVLVLAVRGELAAGLAGRAVEIAIGDGWPDPPISGDDLTAIRMAALLVWLVFMGLAAALLAARMNGRIAAGAFVAMAVVLVAADLFKAGMGATPAIESEEARQPSTPGLERLRSAGLNRFVALDRPLGPSPLIPNMALRWSLYDGRSYDVPVELRYDTLWRRAVLAGGPTDSPTTAARLTERSLPAFRLMSVTAIAQDPAEPPVPEPRLPVDYEREDLRIYANPGALPRAGVVAAQRVVEGEDAELDAVLAPGFDGRRTVVTSSPLPGLGSEPAAGPAGSARIVEYEPERVVVDATARRPSELVLTDLHYPGWRVTLDGESAPLHRVNYLLRGTTLPAGRHRVEFRYEPTSWQAGWIVSLVAVAGLVAAVAMGVRRRRQAA